MIKVLNKGQITSLALQKQQEKNLETLVNYSMAFTLCNIENQLGGRKSTLSMIALSWGQTHVCSASLLPKTMGTHHLCIANVASAFRIQGNESKVSLLFIRDTWS